MMKIFDKLFGKSKHDVSFFPWKPLTEDLELEKALKKSKDTTVVLFKESPRCAISRSVLKKFEKSQEGRTDIDFYKLNVLESRTLSNDIAKRFEIQHESPQIIVFKDAKVIQSESHSKILDLDF